MLAPNSHKTLFRSNEIMCAPDRPAGRWFATSELFLVPKENFQIPVEYMLHDGRDLGVCFVNGFISSTWKGALHTIRAH